MSAPSKQDPTLVKKKVQVEVCDDGVCCVSGDKPFFEVILAKSHICRPYYLAVPAHVVPNLPGDVVPMVLTHGHKKWNMWYDGKSYNGKARQHHRFDPTGWKTFVSDNNLRCGDACIFELMESSAKTFRLRVVILRSTNHVPPQLHPVTVTKGDGRTPETPIQIH